MIIEDENTSTQLTIHDFFFAVSALRNPELMRILKDIELVEALGFGIRGITKVYDKSIFEFTDNTVYVQLPFDKEVIESKGISKRKILELIKNDAEISVSEIAEVIGLSVSGVEKNIRQLKQEGVIIRTTDTKSGKWIVNE